MVLLLSVMNTQYKYGFVPNESTFIQLVPLNLGESAVSPFAQARVRRRTDYAKRGRYLKKCV